MESYHSNHPNVHVTKCILLCRRTRVRKNKAKEINNKEARKIPIAGRTVHQVSYWLNSPTEAAAANSKISNLGWISIQNIDLFKSGIPATSLNYFWTMPQIHQWKDTFAATRKVRGLHLESWNWHRHYYTAINNCGLHRAWKVSDSQRKDAMTLEYAWLARCLEAEKTMREAEDPILKQTETERIV